MQAELAELEARRDDAAWPCSTPRPSRVRQAREQAVAGVPADLLALYEKVRAASAGSARPGWAGAAARAAGSS